MNDNFLCNKNLFYLYLNIVLYFFNLNDSFHFYDFLNDLLYCHNLRNFLNDLDNSFNDLRHFNDSFNNLFNLDNLFNYVGDDNWHFERYVNDSFDFLDLFNFDDFFGDFINSDNLWDFDDSFDNFFNNFLYFNDFRNNSENFEDIVNVNNSHDLLPDHSNDSFVHFKDNTGSEFDFLEFFKKGLDQNSQVELNFSGLFAGVSVNVFDFNDLWDVLDDFNEPIDLINFNNIDELLLEEFHEFSVHFSLELGILEGQSLEVSGQKVEQVLGSGVLDWDFDGSFRDRFQVEDISCYFVNVNFMLF